MLASSFSLTGIKGRSYDSTFTPSFVVSFRISVRSVKSFGIGLKRTEAGIGAEINPPAAIFDVRKILRVGVVKDSSAQSHEMLWANLDEFWLIHVD